jgi:hypothetical protein
MKLLAIYIFSVLGMMTMIDTKIMPIVYKKWYSKTDRIKMDEYLDFLSTMKFITYCPFINTLILCFFGLFLWKIGGK